MLSRQGLWRLVGLVLLLSLVVSCAPAATPAPTEPVAGETPEADATATSVPAVEMGELVETFQLMTLTATEDPRRFEISRMVADAWKDFGFPVELLPVDSSVLVSSAFEGKTFDIYFIHHGGVWSEPDWWLYLFHSSRAGDTGLNFSGYQNPEFDALLDAQRAETDPAKRKELIDQCQEWLYDAKPFHPFAHLQMAGVYNKDTFSDPTISVTKPLYNFWALRSLKPVGDQKVIRVGMSRDFNTANPLNTYGGESFFWLNLTYDTLARIGPDGTPQPWAAESIDAISASEYEVTLREGMTFHDGEPVTAEDVVFSFQYPKEKEAGYYASLLGVLEEAEVVGPNKVRLTLNEPSAPFVSNVLTQVFILPKHIWENIETPLEFPNENPVGSGPWTFDHWRPMEESQLSRFEDHFQPPEAEGVLHVIFGSVDGVLGAMEQGTIDVVGEDLGVPQVEQLMDLPHVEVVEVVEFGMTGYYVNTRFEPFNDGAFRQALALTLPVDDVIKVPLHGAADPAGSIIAPALEFWHNDSIPPFSYDPDQAREMLLQAGYTWDSEGRLHYPATGNDNRVMDTGPQLY